MKLQKFYALVLGIIMIVIGVWGALAVRILDIIGINVLQSIIFFVAGLIGVYVGLKKEGFLFNSIVGWAGVILATLGVIPATAIYLASWFGVNTATTWLHLGIGILSFAVYFISDY